MLASSHPTTRNLLKTAVHVAALAAMLATPAAARAAVAWHADLAAARAASASSQRPLLVVFTAEWTPAGNSPEQALLGSAEAAALVGACFEAVHVDVDTHADLVRGLRITHVPCACVIDANDSVVARFDLPMPGPQFVAAAATAARDAAARKPRVSVAEVSDLGVRTVPSAEAAPTSRFTAATATDAAVAGTQPSGAESISVVTAKVRDLSDFASGPPAGAAAAAATPSLPGPATAFTPSPLGAVPNPAPTAWPPEKPATALGTTLSASTAAAAPTSAPAPTVPPIAPPTTATPWLSSPPAAAATAAAPTLAQPPAGPAATAVPSTASAVPEKPATPSMTSQFMAAMQKPFTFWQKPTTSGTTAVPPPTMPPARPGWPGTLGGSASAPTVATPSATAAGTTTMSAAVEPDRFGSMPLGLEGYCPVTLAEKATWTEGRAQWGARHRGRTYLFAGPEQQQAFLADPDRYAPALSGDDPVLALEAGTSKPGQRRYGVTYQARVYLFSSPETRQAFTTDPARYTTRVAQAEHSTATRVF